MTTKTTTIEVPVEEQTIQSEVATQECVDEKINAVPADAEEVDSAESGIAQLDKEGVLTLLAERYRRSLLQNCVAR